MINTGIFTKSTISKQSQIFGDEQFTSLPSSTTVNKGILFHLINAHIFLISTNEGLQVLQKKKLIYEFGYKTAQNLVEEECIGFVKHCIAKSQKNQTKQFVGEMKLLNSKIWQCLVGSKGKLFSVSNENLKSSSYKIEDKQFALGKAFANSTDAVEKNIRQLMIQFCQGVIIGTLDKVCIGGEITCLEGTQASINIELKNLYRKEMPDKFQQYSLSIQPSII